MFCLILIPFLLYAFLLLAFFIAWRRRDARHLQPTKDTHLISIIVPFRNEARNLKKIWKSLQAQENAGPVEMIFVDDHSEDEGIEIIQKEADKEHSIAVIIARLDKNEEGKKAALQKGLALSSGDFLLFTDADVLHPPRWVQTMRQALSEKEGTHLCWGGIHLSGQKSMILHLQQLEYGILMLCGAASPVLGFPLLCSGANLIIKKSSLQSLGTDPWHREIASGDDVFLMHGIWKHFGKGSVRFVKRREALCETPGMYRWKDLYAQRLRWAGKSGKAGTMDLITGLLVVLANLAFLYVLALYAFGQVGLASVGLCLALKTIPEWVLASAWARWAGQSTAMRSFPWLIILYPVTLVFLLIGTLRGRTSWKGRKVSVR